MWTTCEDAETCTAKQLLYDDKARKLKDGLYDLLDECDIVPFQQDAPLAAGLSEFATVGGSLT